MFRTHYRIKNYEHINDVIGICNRIQGDCMAKDTEDVPDELPNLSSSIAMLSTSHPLSCILADTANQLIKALQTQSSKASAESQIASGTNMFINTICNEIGFAVSNLYNINESLFRKSSWTQDNFLGYARSTYGILRRFNLIYPDQTKSILRSVRNLGLSLRYKHYSRAKRQSHNLLKYM